MFWRVINASRKIVQAVLEEVLGVAKSFFESFGFLVNPSVEGGTLARVFCQSVITVVGGYG